MRADAPIARQHIPALLALLVHDDFQTLVTNEDAFQNGEDLYNSKSIPVISLERVIALEIRSTLSSEMSGLKYGALVFATTLSSFFLSTAMVSRYNVLMSTSTLVRQIRVPVVNATSELDGQASNDSPFYSNDNDMEILFSLPSDGPDPNVYRNVFSTIRPDSTNTSHLLESCKPTAQVQIRRSITTGSEQWFLQAIDKQGKEKTVGGDEFYVTYTDSSLSRRDQETSTFVATVKDLKNGMYSLDFSTTPMNPHAENLTGRGTLKVYFQYTCEIGFFYPPQKDGWTTGAPSRVVHSHPNVTVPSFRRFQPPNEDKAISLSQYDNVISFGDSMMELFVKGDAGFYRNRTTFKRNIFQPINNETLDRALYHLSLFHDEQLKRPNVALVLGSSIWDIIADYTTQAGPNYDSHMTAIRDYIGRVREKYPTVPLYWKSPSALHIHVVQASCFRRETCIKGTRYMSESRSRRLYELQKELMNKLNVPWMDLYEAYFLSADYTKWGDGRHFQDAFSQLLLSWFYRNQNDTVDDLRNA